MENKTIGVTEGVGSEQETRAVFFLGHEEGYFPLSVSPRISALYASKQAVVFKPSMNKLREYIVIIGLKGVIL